MILVFKSFFWVLENCFGVLSGMTDKTQKSKSKKKPKLSEEEKREKVRETLLKKKAYETRALALVEQLLEPNIRGNLVLSQLPQPSPSPQESG